MFFKMNKYDLQHKTKYFKEYKWYFLSLSLQDCICISAYQTLSEEFIREFKDRVNWNYISHVQILSEDFIREFKDRVDWTNIFKRQKLSKKFRKEFECLK